MSNALPEPKPEPKTGLGAPFVFALVLSVLMIGGGIAWSYFTEINGAVISSGKIVVQGKPKSIQHLDGGVVDTILVQDGDRVSKGQPLISLDATLLKANLEIYRQRYANALALRDRLEAEQLGAETLIFDAAPTLVGSVDLEPILSAQQAIFQAREDVQTGRLEQLQEKVLQYRNQIRGTQILIDAKREQLQYINQELTSLQTLQSKKLVRESRILGIQRSRADILGQIGEHQAEVSRISNSIRDTELEMLQLVRQVREEAATGLRETNASILEIAQQIISTEKQLERVEVRAPVDGIIHELQIVTLGGVVPPGATILQIIPTSDGLVFETRIDPAAVDQVYVGQEAKLVLAAFNQTTTPELQGTVRNVSPDTVVDQSTGLSFYRATITATQQELSRLQGLEMIPGMPVEAFLRTDRRSVLSYLVKPLTDQIKRAFREE